MSQENTLKRVISLPALVLYGLGTMVGGGFYALIGKVAGEAGALAPLALMLSGVVALVNGLSFAELSSRFPVSAGQARYIQEAFGLPWLARLAGWMVIFTGVVSAATLSVAGIGFLQDLIPVPTVLGIVVLTLLLGAISAYGVGEAVWFVIIITVLEVSVLIFVVAYNIGNIGQYPKVLESSSLGGVESLLGILSASFLAFYAFIGFEDMVNMAEEVKQPRRNLPLGILLSVLGTSTLYLLVGLVAVCTMPPSELAAVNTPIAALLGGLGGEAGRWFLGGVSMLTGINGALVQIIMASRVAYGMARQDLAPAFLGEVHPWTRTPLVATAVMTGIVLVFALLFPLTTLAKTTSAVILCVFALMNGALLKIKRANPAPREDGIELPLWLPAVGLAMCIVFLLTQVVVLVVG